MKSLPLMICLSLFLIFTSPGWAEDGDYKTMILEFEKFRSTYQTGILNKELGQLEGSLKQSKSDAEITELQQRWAPTTWRCGGPSASWRSTTSASSRV